MLSILQDEKVVAELTQESTGWTLRYNADARTGINPALPIEGGGSDSRVIHLTGPLRPLISLLPKGERLTRLAQSLGVKEDEFVKLFGQCLTVDNVGDLKCVTPVDQNVLTEVAVSTSLSIQDLNSLNRPQLRARLSKEIESRLASTGIGGFAPKAFIKSREGQFIVKQYPDEKNAKGSDIAATECASLKAYRAVGGEVVESHVFDNVLAVKRFDINPARGRYSVCHIADLSQEQDPCAGSYEGVIDKTLEIVGQPAAQSLLKQVAFSWVLGNNHMHRENVALIGKGTPQTWTLSPAYDLLPNRFLTDTTDELALTLNNKKKKITPADFSSLAEKVGLKTEDLNEFLRSSVASIRAQVMPVMPERCREAFGKHLDWVSDSLDGESKGAGRQRPKLDLQQENRPPRREKAKAVEKPQVRHTGS